MMSGISPPKSRPENVFEDVANNAALYELLSKPEGKKRLDKMGDLIREWKGYVDKVSAGLSLQEAQQQVESEMRAVREWHETARKELEEARARMQEDAAARQAKLAEAEKAFKAEMESVERRLNEREIAVKEREAAVLSSEQTVDTLRRRMEDARQQAEAAKAGWEKKVRDLVEFVNS